MKHETKLAPHNDPRSPKYGWVPKSGKLQHDDPVPSDAMVLDMGQAALGLPTKPTPRATPQWAKEIDAKRAPKR
jgi:hypothetical protein